MTGNDHTDAVHGDVITGALRSPALPFERVHEAAVLTEMVDALTTAPEPSSVRRHRRVAAFAAVTVASLGVGGIIAAGPGGFRPFINDDKPPATTIFDDSVPVPAPDDDTNDDDDDGGTDRITTDLNVDCAEDDTANHGQTVSSAAKDPGPNNAAAQSDCGKPVGSGSVGSGNGNGDNGNQGNGGTDRITTDPDFECAEDDTANHGQTVSSAAKDPGPNNAAAQSDCGKPVGSAGNANGNDGNQGNGGTENTGNGNGTGNDATGNNRNGNGNDGIPGPPASTPGNPDPGPPASTPGNGNGNGNDGIPGPPASTPRNPDPGPPASTPGNGNGNGNDGIPGPPASTPGNPDPGPPASTPNNGNGNGNTTTTQPAG